MVKELTRQDHGNLKDNQWYEIYPQRLNEEIKLVKECYPNFIFGDLQNRENAFWEGVVKSTSDNGKELYSLRIKIECDKNYPLVFPRVYDIEGILQNQKCPHLNEEKNTICYGNRLDSQLDFTKETRVRNVIDFVSIFLARQWYFEKKGEWPDGQLHGGNAFLEHEIRQGKIPLNELCPCGMTTINYKNCHFPEVKRLLAQLEAKYSERLKNVRIKIGRNEKCPCESGKKSKKCCFNEINHKNSKFFLLAKYPKLTKRVKIEKQKGRLIIS